jgi:hypothetical protein
MDWIQGKSLWLLRPEFAEVFVGDEAPEGLKSSGEVVGFEEICQVCFKLVVALDYVVSLDGSPLSWSRSGVIPVPQCLLLKLRKPCTIKCRDCTPSPRSPVCSVSSNGTERSFSSIVRMFGLGL